MRMNTITMTITMMRTTKRSLDLRHHREYKIMFLNLQPWMTLASATPLVSQELCMRLIHVKLEKDGIRKV